MRPNRGHIEAKSWPNVASVIHLSNASPTSEFVQDHMQPSWSGVHESLILCLTSQVPERSLPRRLALNMEVGDVYDSEADALEDDPDRSLGTASLHAGLLQDVETQSAPV